VKTKKRRGDEATNPDQPAGSFSLHAAEYPGKTEGWGKLAPDPTSFFCSRFEFAREVFCDGHLKSGDLERFSAPSAVRTGLPQAKSQPVHEEPRSAGNSIRQVAFGTARASCAF
jgi:hypothetical protein